MKPQWELDTERLVAQMRDREVEPKFDLVEAMQQARSEIVEILVRLEKGSGRTVEALELATHRQSLLSGRGPTIVGRSVLITLSPLPAENWSTT